MSSTDQKLELSAIESSVLDYVINLHRSQTNGKRSAYIALLCHACLIARKAKITGSDQSKSSSVLPSGWASNDPIRINYQIPSGESASTTSGTSENSLQLSITETDDRIFVNFTNTTTDKFGHLELSGPAHVRLDSTKSNDTLKPTEVFSQLESTLYEMDENLWKTVLPKPPKPAVRNVQQIPLNPMGIPVNNPGIGTDPLLRDYGRSDLDPLGGPDWTRPLGGTGGMVLDPTQALRQPFGMPRPGLGGMVPPGARFDPIGPPMMPSRGIGPRGSRFNNPDPDSALPPGWEDMYM